MHFYSTLANAVLLLISKSRAIIISLVLQTVNTARVFEVYLHTSITYCCVSPALSGFTYVSLMRKFTSKRSSRPARDITNLLR